MFAHSTRSAYQLARTDVRGGILKLIVVDGCLGDVVVGYGYGMLTLKWSTGTPRSSFLSMRHLYMILL